MLNYSIFITNLRSTNPLYSLSFFVFQCLTWGWCYSEKTTWEDDNLELHDWERRCFFPKCEKSFKLLHGEWRKNPFTLIKTGDVLSQSVDRARHEMKMFVASCPPGPNVLLLLANPSDFTEADRQKVRSVMSLLGQDACSYAEITSSSVNQLVQECGQRNLRVNFSEKKYFSQWSPKTDGPNGELSERKQGATFNICWRGWSQRCTYITWSSVGDTQPLKQQQFVEFWEKTLVQWIAHE